MFSALSVFFLAPICGASITQGEKDTPTGGKRHSKSLVDIIHLLGLRRLREWWIAANSTVRVSAFDLLTLMPHTTD
jgi:hypothetical protein